MQFSSYFFVKYTIEYKIKLLIKKFAPYGTDSRLLTSDVSSESRDTKTRPNIKNLAPISFSYCALI